MSTDFEHANIPRAHELAYLCARAHECAYLYVCLCVYKCVCIYGCLHVCIYVHVCMHVCSGRACMQVTMYINMVHAPNMFVFISVNMKVHLDVPVSVRTDAST